MSASRLKFNYKNVATYLQIKNNFKREAIFGQTFKKILTQITTRPKTWKQAAEMKLSEILSASADLPTQWKTVATVKVKESFHQNVKTVIIGVRHGDAGDAIASPTLKNWPLFGQKFLKFEQSIQLNPHVSEVVSIFQTKAM